ncbi:MAG: energy transducer TonB [Alphaproteobacteria bacterium]|nr:energy transducer TonB [Alphaproteobacteria bacterium]
MIGKFFHKFKIDREVLPSLSASVVLHGLMVVGLSGFIGNWGAKEFNAESVVPVQPPQAEVYVELVETMPEEIPVVPEIVPEKVNKVEKEKAPASDIKQDQKILKKEPEKIPEVKAKAKTVPEKKEAAYSVEMKEAGISGVDSYAARVTSKINVQKFYPPQAIRMHEEGDVVISFRIDRTGDVHDVKIAGTSFSHSLDRAALKAVEKAAPFEPPPEYLSERDLSFKVPVRYRLHTE